MKINHSTGTVESTLNGNDSTAMRIDSAGMAHIMSLLTNLYSDAPLAVLREYATNARDAVIEAGTGAPVEVTLPTPLNPALVIQDYGTGLTETEIVHIYAQYGTSTKRDTDEQVGAFGIGSKSALTLGTQFVVTAVKDQRKTVAVFGMDESGVGTVNITHRADTSDHNGVTVSIGVNDTAPFEDAARRLFRTWPTGSVLVNGEPPASIYSAGLSVSDAVHLLPGTEEGLYVVMGGVPYPVSDSLILAVLTNPTPRHAPIRGLLNRSSVYATVPIGAVDLAPSREALRDTERTITALWGILKALPSMVFTAIDARIGDAGTLADAAAELKAYRGLLAAVGDLDKTFTWNGQDVHTRICLPGPHIEYFLPLGSTRVKSDRCPTIQVENVRSIVVISGVTGDSGKLPSATRWLSHNRTVQSLISASSQQDTHEWFTYGPGGNIRTVTYEQYIADLKAIHHAEPPTADGESSRGSGYDVLGGTSMSVGAIRDRERPVMYVEYATVLQGDYTTIMLRQRQTSATLLQRFPDAKNATDVLPLIARDAIEAMTGDDLVLVDAVWTYNSLADETPVVLDLLGEREPQITHPGLRDRIKRYRTADSILAYNSYQARELASVFAIATSGDPAGDDHSGEQFPYSHENLPLLNMALHAHRRMHLDRNAIPALIAYINAERS